MYRSLIQSMSSIEDDVEDSAGEGERRQADIRQIFVLHSLVREGYVIYLSLLAWPITNLSSGPWISFVSWPMTFGNHNIDSITSH